MDQDWGGWPDDDDPTGDSADTSDLDRGDLGAGHGETLGYDEPGGYPDAHDLGDPGDGGGSDTDGHTDPGYLDDEPMSVLGDDHDLPDLSDGADVPGDGGDDGGDPPGDGPDAWQVPDDDGEPVSTETVVGANPDVDPDADWSPADFPEQLDLTPPAPVDGYPWSDPGAVAEPGTGDDPTTLPQGAPPAADLLDYAGTEGSGDPWAALLGSDDPAASSLGRWWGP